MLTRLTTEDLAGEWAGLATQCEWPELPQRLAADTAAVFSIGGRAAVVLTVGRTRDSNVRALWIAALAGHVGFKPKANLRLMNDVLTEIETMARQAGCTEMRIEPGDRADWKRRLLPVFGFMPMVVGQSVIMRKELS